MRPLHATIFILLSFLMLRGCVHDSVSRDSPDFVLAATYNEHSQTPRVEAALRLSHIERAKLCRVLIDQLPGEWNVKSVQAIYMLGLIGNNDTEKILQDLLDRGGAPSGQCYSTILFAIEKIQKRNGEVKKG